MILTDICGKTYNYDLHEGECPIIDKDIFAKRIITGKGFDNFVLASNDGILFNPLDIGNDRNKKDRMRGSYFYNLLRCSTACYDTYIVYLKHKNKKHLTLAQRKFSDGY